MMTWKKLTAIFLTVFSLLNGATLLGQETRYAGAFLELGIGARSLAMGQAYVSVADDNAAFYWNPAGVSNMVRTEVSGMYASLYKGLVQHYHAGITRPLYGAGAVSINFIRLAIPDVPEYDSELLETTDYERRVFESTRSGDWEQYALTAGPLGLTTVNDDAIVLTLSKLNKFDVDFGWQYFVMPITIPIGLNIKYIRQSLFENRGSGIGFDLGTMFKFGLDDLFDDSRLGKVAFALAVKDIGNTRITWDTDSRQGDRIQRSWHFGGSYLQPLTFINGQLLLSYAGQKKYGTTNHFGLEYLYYNRLAVRFGVDNDRFTAGVGLKISLIKVDYAFRSHDLGTSHRINTSIQL